MRKRTWQILIIVLALFIGFGVGKLVAQEPTDTIFLPPDTITQSYPVEVVDTAAPVVLPSPTVVIRTRVYMMVPDTTFRTVVDTTFAEPDTVLVTDTVQVEDGDTTIPEPDDTLIAPIPDTIDNPEPGTFSGPAELPRRYVEIDTNPPADTVNVVDLQDALNAAQCGTAYRLGTHVGNFRYFGQCPDAPVWLVGGSITSAGNMPLDLGDAVGLRVTGTRVEADAGDRLENTLINLDGGRDIQLLGVVAIGHDNLDLRRCVRANGDSLAIVDSELLGCHADGADAQAVVVWNSRGPLLIQGSILEGSGENFMAGGSDSESAEFNPRDITIRGNHFYKPPEWFGARWSIKNLIEIKNAHRVLIEDNTFENSWVHAQSYAILFKSVNQGGGTKGEWSKATDITFRRNHVRNVASVFNLAARPEQPVAEPLSRVHIVDNYVEMAGKESDFHEGDRHRAVTLLDDLRDITFEHNTILGSFANQLLFEGPDKTGLVFRNNAVGRANYGMLEDWLTTRAIDPVWTGNVWGPASSGWRDYPSGDCSGADPILPPPDACADAGSRFVP